MDNPSHLPDTHSNSAPDDGHTGHTSNAGNTSQAGEAIHLATSAPSTISAPSATPSRDEEYSLPCTEAVLAGTLALMTGHAQACCCSQRDALGRKIVAGLHQLAHSDQFTPHFRALLGSLQNRWAQQCAADAQMPRSAALSAAEQRRALWVQAPRTVQ